MVDTEDKEKSSPTTSASAPATPNGLNRLTKTLALAGTVVMVAAAVEAFTAPFAKTPTANLSITLAVLAVGILLIALYTYRKTKITMTVGQIAACATLVMLAGAVLIYAAWHHKVIPTHHSLAAPSQSPSHFASPSTAPSSRTSVPSQCPHSLTITSPANGTVIANGNEGVDVKITACGLGVNQVGWLFDYDTGDGTYNFDGNGGPVVIANGKSAFLDQPIGNPGDINKLTIITLVLADASCNQTLAQLQSGSPPTTLPSSCQIASRVDVYVTYPTNSQ
jgi:hypothetical protein